MDLNGPQKKEEKKKEYHLEYFEKYYWSYSIFSKVMFIYLY